MKRLIIISILISAVAITAEAQLIEDSQSKLKTTTVKRKGFLFFGRKGRKNNSNGIPSGGTGNAPRYSSIGSPFKITKGVSPRYSSPRQKIKRYSVNPRFSSGGVAKFKERNFTPRYSTGNPFRGSRYVSSPRYSGGNPFRGADYKVNPRYSRANPFRGSDFRVSPRYSQGSPFRGKGYKVSPRYSQGNPFRGYDFRVSPRYSQGSPFSKKDFKVQPRYSAGSPFRGVNYKVKPRYSDLNFRNRFYIDKTLKKQLAYYNVASNWKGDMKINHKRIGDQHPSSNYHLAMRFHSPQIRKMFRKWNVFWIRVNGNKLYSDGVKEKIKEPKFDKKERVLWNN